MKRVAPGGGMAAQHILVTGFEPFAGEPVNPSALLVQALHGTRLAGAVVHAHVLPCVFGDALAALHVALAELRPVLVLALGQAGGRSALSVERVAINVDDARIADNAGAQPLDRPVVASGPAAYFSTLPIKAMVAAVRTAGLPAEVSQTAGTFVCNHVFYGLMHALADGVPGLPRTALAATRGGFMHVPWLPEQAARQRAANPPPSLSLADQLRGVQAALQAAWQVADDLPISGGAES
jgi:pyroglutamyl-peptidase